MREIYSFTGFGPWMTSRYYDIVLLLCDTAFQTWEHVDHYMPPDSVQQTKVEILLTIIVMFLTKGLIKTL